MRYVVNLLAAPGLFYSGFVHTFWGNDPYLGWAIIGTLLLVSWVSLGVGEPPEKTEMMLDNLPMPKITGV
ncbi:MAG: hypothetical protein VX629_05375 [Pseudomonadota bacterium]|nr:hypothetical protein [Pseudomonadota bacterium]